MQVQEAAVIGIPHPKWTERPLLVVVKAAGSSVCRDDILDFLKASPELLLLSMLGYLAMSLSQLELTQICNLFRSSKPLSLRFFVGGCSKASLMEIRKILQRIDCTMEPSASRSCFKKC